MKEDSLSKSMTEILDFRDITKSLSEEELDHIQVNDLIREVLIQEERLENHYGKKERVYSFCLKEYNIRGRVFPLDEIIKVGYCYDLVIKNLKGDNPPMIDTQVYHDLYKGEVLRVQISGKKPGFDPSFKIFNHIAGFVKNSRNGLYEKIQEGDKVLVEVFDLNKDRKGFHIVVWPLKILNGTN